MDGGGITISTASAIAALVSLVGVISTLLKLLRDQLVTQIVDLKAENKALREDVKAQNSVLKQAVEVIERTGDILERSTVVTEEVVRKVPGATRRQAAS